MTKPPAINELAKAGPPPAAVMRMLAQHSREQLEGFIEIAIGLLDLADGDPDQEGAHDEDELSTAFFMVGKNSGAGCQISDPDSGADDFGENEPPEPDRVSPIGIQ